jgi:hypothetical protein
MAAMDKQSLKPIREQIIYANLLLMGWLLVSLSESSHTVFM